MRPLSTARRCLLGVLAGGALAIWLAPVSVPARAASPAPRCFGAAARDSLHPCSNPSLKLAVIPTPSDALLTPNAFCDPLGFRGLNICAFGVNSSQASGSVALVGNSHAGHWRAALAVAARAMNWQGISITRSSCPFTSATSDLAEPERARCVRWRRGVLAWFRSHPEVKTVFTTNQPSVPWVPPGGNPLAAQIAGYKTIWAELPPSVEHIVVIRDNPYTSSNVLTCVGDAISRRQDAGLKCAEPRSQALKTDPAVIAAQELDSPRVQVIDMTRYFCDSELCYPVIGGALVYRDADHLTRVFAATLGPYLLQEVRRLDGSWQGSVGSPVAANAPSPNPAGSAGGP